MFDGCKKEVWSFGGGKGGVGKSLICANVALALAEKGAKVVIIDGDFGSANLHTCFGMRAPEVGVSDFLNDEKASLSENMVETPYKNVRLIGGGEDSLRISNPKFNQLQRLINQLKTLDADYILLDIGAGTSIHSIDMFIQGDKGVLVSMPEPSSIENTYRFIKYAFYRKLRMVTEHQSIRTYLNGLMNDKQTSGRGTPQRLFSEISAINEQVGVRLKNEIERFSLKLVMNQVRNNNDVRLGFSMSTSCKKYFGIRLEYTGFVESDANMLRSIRNRRPVIKSDPFARCSRGIKKIMENLENNEHIVTSIL